ncbi:hypothetical protein [Ruegeria meonggei]|uniref:hypothetical protein n=1 Tax=Ruegeria meonggei TaxID=1446476 RepID=UPI003670EF7A
MARAKQPMIWISDAMVSTSSIKGFDQDNYLKDNELSVDAMKRNNVGEPLPENRFPKEMYAEYKDKKEKTRPVQCGRNLDGFCSMRRCSTPIRPW